MRGRAHHLTGPSSWDDWVHARSFVQPGDPCRVFRAAVERIAATPTRYALTRDGKGSQMISRASLVKIRSVLGQVLDYAERRGLVNRNVARLAILPATARRTQAGRALTTDQARTLLEEAKNDRLYALWVVQLMLGVRPGEAIGLTWDDVDLKGNVLHVRRNRRFEHGRFVLGDELKTKKSRRSLTMPDPVLRALRDRQIEQREERLAAGPLWSTEWSALVFTTLVGTPLHASNVRRQFTAITERSGLGRWHPHELRHSAASILSAAGVPLERVADVLGHDGTRMTALVYRHAVSPSVDAAQETMGKVFGSIRACDALESDLAYFGKTLSSAAFTDSCRTGRFVAEKTICDGLNPPIRHRDRESGMAWDSADRDGTRTRGAQST